MCDKRVLINRTIHLLEKNQDEICWDELSENPNAISILEKNQDKINWDQFSKNPNAIELLEKNQDPNNILILLDDKLLSLNLLL